jgi:hypothetical protein
LMSPIGTSKTEAAFLTALQITLSYSRAQSVELILLNPYNDLN